jgi:predicted PolB exonuclease-like 3'-5' exonuclease
MIAALARRQEYNQHHLDLFQLLTAHKYDFKSLRYFLMLYGVGGKINGIDGSLVYPMWKEGMYKEIQEYCEHDVLQTAALFRRVAPWEVPSRKNSDFNAISKKEQENA